MSVNILLRHNCVAIPDGTSSASEEDLATVLMNVAYYGYSLSVASHQALTKLNHDELTMWWKDVETNLKQITGDDRKIDNFVVYKNFPAECLSKSDAEYWIPQILMYWGFPSDLFTQPAKPREKMNENRKATVLRRAKNESLGEILDSYLASPARWKDQEFKDILELTAKLPFGIAKIKFKENLIKLATTFIESNKRIAINTATDVLRLAVGLSGGDVSLTEKTKFISFKKPVRRYLLELLEDCTNLTEDMARRPELFKKFLNKLHPGDHKRRCPNVCEAMDGLYNDQLVTFNGKVEPMLLAKDAKVLTLLATRPGEFRRRLVHVLELFGDKAVEAFLTKGVVDKLTTHQVVALRTYLTTVNDRLQRCFPPKGNWNKLQIGEARWVEERYVIAIVAALSNILRKRLPKVKVLDPATKMIKLASNGSDTSQYTRGTVFPIPDEVEFIRTASYWKNDPKKGVTWFDNGWNFFDDNWNVLGSCCWTNVRFGDNAATFSGDPVNTKEMEGRAAQLIDLYPSKLVKSGVRYAVWNILCFSRISFDAAEDVFAALQWGKDPQKGNLFEPSRCQLSFQLKSKQMTKYVCVIDLKERKMIYLDANLHGDVQSANGNGKSLKKNLPPFMEYLDSIPSVHDLFSESVSDDGVGHILYSDKDVALQDVPAYVFMPENKSNKFNPINVNSILM